MDSPDALSIAFQVAEESATLVKLLVIGVRANGSVLILDSGLTLDEAQEMGKDLGLVGGWTTGKRNSQNPLTNGNSALKVFHQVQAWMYILVFYLVQKAHNDLSTAVTEAISKHPDLTYLELLAILNQIAASWIKYGIQDERNPNEAIKPGDKK